MARPRSIAAIARDRSGASFIVALSVFAICAVVAALVVSMAGAAAERANARAREQQARLAVSSALETVTTTIAEEGTNSLGVYDIPSTGTTYQLDATTPEGTALPRVNVTLKRVGGDVIGVACQLANTADGYAYSLSANVNTTNHHITAG